MKEADLPDLVCAEFTGWLGHRKDTKLHFDVHK